MFEGFRGVGKAQTGCLKVSEASEGASGTLAKIAGYQENTSQAAAAAPRVGRGRQGRRPSMPGTRKTSQAAAAAPRSRKGPSETPAKHAGYQENFAGGRSRPEGRKGPSGTPAKHAGYQENFAGGRSRPEESEGAVRDAGQACRVPGKLRRRPQPPRGVGKAQKSLLTFR